MYYTPYYIAVVIDDQNNVDEAWEIDNRQFFSKMISWGGPSGDINLTFSRSGTNSTHYDYDTHELAVTCTIENTETIDAGQFRVSIYLDSLSTTEYVLFHQEVISGLPAGTPHQINITHNLDTLAGIQNAWYTVTVVIDDQEVVNELNKDDNYAVFQPLNLFEYNSSYLPNLMFYANPDLQPYPAENSMSYDPADHLVTFKTAFINLGSSITTPFDFGFYLSEDQIINPLHDTLINSIPRNHGLGADQKVVSPQNISLPLDSYVTCIPPNTYYFGVYLDNTAAINEYHEDDNALVFTETNQLIHWPGYCVWDFYSDGFNSDGDIDGQELALLAYYFQAGVATTGDVSEFAQYFCRDDFGYAPQGSTAASQTLSMFDPLAAMETASLSLLGSDSTTALKSYSSSKNSFDTASSAMTSPVASAQSLNNIDSTATGQATSSLDNFIIREVKWSSFDGQSGVASGNDLQWFIQNIDLFPGSNFITVELTDYEGNVGKKVVEVIVDGVHPERNRLKSNNWVRHFVYESRRDIESDLPEIPTAVDITLFCWPDRIAITDIHVNSDDISEDITLTWPAPNSLDNELGNSEFVTDYTLDLLSDNNEYGNVLYLDIPPMAIFSK